MRILLINPNYGAAERGRRRYGRSWPPLDLLNAAALLKQAGHDPVLYDLRARPELAAHVETETRKADLVVLQTTPLDRWQCPDLNINALSDLLAVLPLEKLIIAGTHGTVRPDYMLRMTGAQAVIRGEPELTVLDVCESGGNLNNIASLSFISVGKTIHTNLRAPLDLNDMPVPAYELIKPGHYGYELTGDKMGVLETSRGCPFQCSFCLKSMYGKGVRYKSSERVVSEVEHVVNEWGAESLYFIDLEFTLNRAHVLDICRGLKDAGLDVKWCCQTRVDAVDSELLEAMKDSGCVLIHFGLETGSERLLRETGKGINLKQVSDAFSICRRLKLNTAAFFLFGLPGETRKDRRETMALCRRIKPDYASFHIASPYPETKLNESCEVDDVFPPCIISLKSSAGAALTRDVRNAYFEFYLRPGYILSQMRNNDLKSIMERMKLFWKVIR